MLGRLASLRLRLLAAMIATALIGLAAAYFAIGHILAASEQASDQRQAEKTAQTIAARLGAGAGLELLTTAQSVLRAVQIVVYRHGQAIFTGPALPNEPLETTVTKPFPGGRVVVRKYELSASSSSLEVTLVAAAVSGLVILTVLVITAMLTRTVRGPIERAIVAADRVAVGDLTARMGGGGPDEFNRLSHAFDSMAERLEVADAEQRRFLADIAHEVATPVNALSNLAAALADGTAATDSDRAETAALLAEETRRVQTLLDDLRQLTRLDLAEPVRWEHVDLRALCHTLARRFERDASTAGLRLVVKAEALTTTSNQRVLETILTNLLTNAIRYTPPGGSIILQTRRQHGRPILSVKDTGIGIPPEHRSRIFDRLYRIDTDRGRTNGGSGLGLAIVRRAAHALDAKIELKSEPGKGSTFTLALPRQDPEHGTHATTRRNQEPRSASVER